MATIHIDDWQYEKIVEWHNRHDCDEPVSHPSMGTFNNGLWVCTSSSSGIGQNVKGRCQCGQEIDVTDYESWQMTVYVDDMYLYPMGRMGRMKMSHMIADTHDELHAMADRIGVKRKWFQGDHYDICLSMREKAIGFGAVEVTMKELVIKLRELKNESISHRDETDTNQG